MIRIFILFLFISFDLHADTICKSKLQKYLLINVYEITLCKENGVEYEGIFDTNFSIKLKYKMSSSGKWIASRSLNEISKNYQLTKKEKVVYEKYFDGFFPNVKNGDEILMEFNSQNGAKFYYNGNFFGDIKDKTLAIRTANIWLHPNSTFNDTRNFLFAK